MGYLKGLWVLLFVLPVNLLAQEKGRIVQIRLDFEHPKQRIDNFGAAGCWYAEEIGKYWPKEQKERIAALLFSSASDAEGRPEGIGLSTWRFNIGAGSAEQGEASGIPSPSHRVECFQLPDGSYDWRKQEGYRWFAQQAKAHGVENLIAFVNSPPVHMTRNGLAYKTNEDGKSNLRPDLYRDFASYLADVVQHFSQEGLVFNYISPVNEPQWKWNHIPGMAKQEGSPYTNEEIYCLVAQLDRVLSERGMEQKIVVPEAAALYFFYDGQHGKGQVPMFWDKKHPLYLGKFKHVSRIMAGHSYFTDLGDDSLIQIRKKVADVVQNHQVDYWQSEYSMLGDGYREGSGKPRSGIDCALFLAKVIHHDLVIGQASAWHFWNAFEPGKAAIDARYYLFALEPDADHRGGQYEVTKNLWALGHFSRFIDKGMQRIAVMWEKEEETQLRIQAQDLMFSAYTNFQGKLVVVAVNYAESDRKWQMAGLDAYATTKVFITDEHRDFEAAELKMNDAYMDLPRKSISTFVFEK